MTFSHRLLYKESFTTEPLTVLKRLRRNRKCMACIHWAAAFKHNTSRTSLYFCRVLEKDKKVSVNTWRLNADAGKCFVELQTPQQSAGQEYVSQSTCCPSVQISESTQLLTHTHTHTHWNQCLWKALFCSLRSETRSTRQRLDKHTHSLFHTHTHTHKHTHTLSHTLTHTHSLTHTHTLTHTLKSASLKSIILLTQVRDTINPSETGQTQMLEQFRSSRTFRPCDTLYNHSVKSASASVWDFHVIWCKNVVYWNQGPHLKNTYDQI